MSLSKKEEIFLLMMEKRGDFVFNSSDAQFYWKNPENTANALSRLTHKHWLERLTRGIYLIRPLEKREKSYTRATKFLIASHLASDAVVAYQSAMHFYKMVGGTYDSNHFVIQTTHRKKPLRIQYATYQFITVPPQSLADTQLFQLDSPATIRVSSHEKTLVDSAMRPDLCSGIFNVLQFIRQFQQVIDWEKMDDLLSRHSNAPAAKRIGYLIDKFKIRIPDSATHLKAWGNHLSQGIIRLEPKSTTPGHIHTHWAIEDNFFEIKGADQ